MKNAMKRVSLILLAGVMVFALAACGHNRDEKASAETYEAPNGEWEYDYVSHGEEHVEDRLVVYDNDGKYETENGTLLYWKYFTFDEETWDMLTKAVKQDDAAQEVETICKELNIPYTCVHGRINSLITYVKDLTK